MKLTPIVLPLVMALLLPMVHFLPDGEMSPSAIRMELPSRLGNWIFRQKAPSKEELEVLASDTKFSKAECLSPREGEYTAITGDSIPDRIDLSVVLSGHDLNNSIHRPERCMPAQGHAIGSSSKEVLELPNGQKIPMRRLLSVQSIALNEERTKYASYKSVTYYFFVGRNRVTEDHLRRTLIDIKDRLVYGVDQRWAYVSVSMWYGNVPWIPKEVTLEEADRKLKNFLEALCAEQLDWNQIK